MAVTYGQQITDAWQTVDTALNLPQASTNNHGSSFDLGAATAPQDVVMRAQLTLDNPEGVPADGYNLDIRVQSSRDGVNWPDDGMGQPCGNFYNAAVGAEIVRSQYIELVPKDRYNRFEYDNSNPVDDSDVTMNVKGISMQGA